MPIATFVRVRDVSSEDNVHLAENLIKNQPGRKWKTKNAGEKSAYVILEMSDSYQITGIDIGNEHSAFIEVLVGNYFSSKEFTEILITCSFMTPTESKSSNNGNRVRCFNRDALVPSVANNKWSLVKILCTQPFNKHVPYGLSFIKVHINDDMTKECSVIQKNIVPEQFLNKTAQVIGKLKFREDSPDSENENSSSLFNRWKKSKHNDGEQITTAAPRRKTSSDVENPKNSLPVKKVDNILYRNPSDVQTLKKDSPDSENENSSSLFNRWKKSKHNDGEQITTAAPRRRTSCDVENPKNSLSLKKDDNILDRNREKLLFGDNVEDTKNKNQKKLEWLSEQIEVDKKRRRSEIDNETNRKPRKSVDGSKLIETNKKVDDLSTRPSCSKLTTQNSFDKNQNLKKRTSSSENHLEEIKPSKKNKPFNQLLKDVVLVISGIQNPDRGELRKKAIALGAKYKADWDSSCTHLICAFKNTPKYNQVKGKGKIVTRSWIEKCYSLRKYLPWRRYALNSVELSKSESDDEIFEDAQSFQNDSPNMVLRKSRGESEERDNTLALYDVDEKSKSNKNSSCSESDTDDEITRIKRKKTTAVGVCSTAITVNIFEASTDEEDYINKKICQGKKIMNNH